MALPSDTLWEIDPHTKVKHEILRRYLGAWFAILGKDNRQINYVDGFCGPGCYKGGESGSPIIALEVASEHKVRMACKIVFWFIDERQDRINNLRNIIDDKKIPSNFRVEAMCGKFHEILGPELRRISGQHQQLYPTFAFIDPFGFSGIPLSVIEMLLKNARCEVFITFMVDSINRFIEHPEGSIREHIVEAFGTGDALQIAMEDGDRVQKLRMLYQRQLEKTAEFVRHFEMRNIKDRILYYLFFVSNHSKGHTRMKEAMWRIAPGGEFSFSDATNPDQQVMFEDQSKELFHDQLFDILLKEFRNKGQVSCGSVRVFIEDKTSFIKKHMTDTLKIEEGAGRVIVAPTKTDGKKRRRNTYPDSSLITFN